MKNRATPAILRHALPSLYLALGLSATLVHAAPTSIAAPRSVYEQATLHYGAVAFFKPAELETGTLEFRLAPLILQELSHSSRGRAGKRNLAAPKEASGNARFPPALGRFGALVQKEGQLGLDLSKPAVYVVPETLQLGGRPHAQLTYLWFYPSSSSAGASGFAVQGVRITLNQSGAPAVWEALADDSNGRLIFVSQSLAQQSAAELGEPFPGRKFAIEPSLSAQPRVFVPRLIDDGPVPMGPILYLRAQTHDVGTLICRCMPAQAGQVAFTGTYKLVAVDATVLRLLAQARAQCCQKTPFWPGVPGETVPLERVLRLPQVAW